MNTLSVAAVEHTLRGKVHPHRFAEVLRDAFVAIFRDGVYTIRPNDSTTGLPETVWLRQVREG